MRVVVFSVVAVCVSGLAFAEPSLTIYNQDFAVVRETVPLDLDAGENRIEFEAITAYVEPDSVILRDPNGERVLRVVEQNYQGAPLSQNRLLAEHEGATLDFLVTEGMATTVKRGRVIRAPEPQRGSATSLFGQRHWQGGFGHAPSDGLVPIVEVDGAVRFGLPGTPLFPPLGDERVLKPRMTWIIAADEAGPLDAELSYVTEGMTWEADYNLVAPEDGDRLEAVGWVSLENRSGRAFEEAQVQLMAGDVRKERREARSMRFTAGGFGGQAREPEVSEEAFDEYHLYTLRRRTTLAHGELKQVEFIRSGGIDSESFYVYDGGFVDEEQYRGWGSRRLDEPEYGAQSHSKVWVFRKFENTEANELGIPLPKGNVRLYRRDADGALQFVGENRIDHTPKGETVRLRTGNAFDLVGERVQTDFEQQSRIVQSGQVKREGYIREAFRIDLRNRKEEPVEVRVVEHLRRGRNWEIEEASHTHEKTDSQTIEFRIDVAPDGEETVTYTAYYPRDP